MHSGLSDVLLIYASKPSGHQSASQAICESLKHLSPKLKITELDFFTKSYPILGPTIASLYLEFVQKIPDFWNYIYKNNRIEEISRELRKFFNTAQLPKIRNYLKKHKPLVVISTHAATSGILAWEKEKNGMSNFFLASVITDFGVNNFWPLKYTDVYFVASEEVKSELTARGVSSKIIEVVGIPVRKDFTFPVSSKSEIFKSLALRQNIFTVLVMGGNHGLGGVAEIVETIVSMKSPIQAIVVCGHNKVLYKSLHNRYNSSSYIRILGYTKEIHQLMEISDVLVSKAGGMTIAEAIHKKLPIIIFSPLPAQEEKNTKYLMDRNAAIYCKNLDELSSILKKISTSPSYLLQYKDKMEKLMPKNASYTIARYILEKLKKYER